MRRLLVLCAASALLAGCERLSDERAERLVRAYLDRTAEAYRKSDEELVKPVTGEDEGRRISALIGLKRDFGLALDASLLELRVVRVERPEGEVVVHTEESWDYLDRRIGTGKQVGKEARDHYRLAYRLRREGERWVVFRVDADAPLEVGRSQEFPAPTGGQLHKVVTPGKEPPPQGGAPAGREGGTPR